MPRVRALRGVCIGVGQVLELGAEGNIDESLFKYLASIGAVERVPDPAPVAAPVQVQAPAKAGKKE